MSGVEGKLTIAGMAEWPRWVVWRNEERGGKLTKIPYSDTGKRAKADDPTTWCNRAQAQMRAVKIVNGIGGGGGGVGIELGDLGDGTALGGIDLDTCLGADGTVQQWALDVLAAFSTYSEISPSGTGLKAFFRYDAANLPDLRKAVLPAQHGKSWTLEGDNHPPAIELHLSNRYFAVTDQRYADSPEELAYVTAEQLFHLIRVTGPAFVAEHSAPSGSGDEDNAEGRPRAGGTDKSRSAAAFRVGGAARRRGLTFEQFCQTLKDDPDTAAWYAEKGTDSNGRELKRIWQKTDPGQQEEGLILAPSKPLNSARVYVQMQHTAGQQRTLHHQNAAFYKWQESHYVEHAAEEMRADLYKFLDTARRLDDDNRMVDFAPNKAKVANVLEALAAAAQLPAGTRPPAWLDNGDHPDASALITCSNGLLDLSTMKLHPITPAFFSLNALDFAYDAFANDPVEWLKFLATLWPEDQESINTLQELFGLLLTADTRYQKAFLIVGPKRSGKGTIARVLTQLLGAANVCAPTLSSVATNFGLAPLIGKRLALIADARLSGKADQSVITERLLSITGEDGQTVDRKFRDAWFGKLDVRFVIMTNELPKLNDSSGALAGRFVVLKMTRSFYGQEDLGLGAKLSKELPGILLWAIEGWKRLTMRRYFITPASASGALEELEDLGSPIGAFVRQCCDIAPGKSVLTTTLYNAWCAWCREQGRDHPGTVQTFGRDLTATAPGVAPTQRRDKAERNRYYEGIDLKAQPKQEAKMAGEPADETALSVPPSWVTE